MTSLVFFSLAVERPPGSHDQCLCVAVRWGEPPEAAHPEDGADLWRPAHAVLPPGGGPAGSDSDGGQADHQDHAAGQWTGLLLSSLPVFLALPGIRLPSRLFSQQVTSSLLQLTWCNCTGWQGIKCQITYLLTLFWIMHADLSFSFISFQQPITSNAYILVQ